MSQHPLTGETNVSELWPQEKIHLKPNLFLSISEWSNCRTVGLGSSKIFNRKLRFLLSKTHEKKLSHLEPLEAPQKLGFFFAEKIKLWISNVQQLGGLQHTLIHPPTRPYLQHSSQRLMRCTRWDRTTRLDERVRSTLPLVKNSLLDMSEHKTVAEILSLLCQFTW